MRLTIAVLIGLPGSGKTTFAKRLKQRAVSDGTFNFIHVCYDHFIPHEKFRMDGSKPDSWKEARLEVLKIIEDTILSLLQNDAEKFPNALKHELQGNNISTDTILIIDDNMYYRSMRYQLYKIATRFNIGFCQIFFNCLLERSLGVNENRDEECKVPSEIIHRMYSKIEQPNLNTEWEKDSVILEATEEFNNAVNKVTELMKRSLMYEEYPKNNDLDVLRRESVIKCITSTYHQTDITLRKIVNSKVQQFLSQKNLCKNSLKDYLCALNTKKSKILSEIKNGEVRVPESVLNEIQQDNVVEKVKLKAFLEDILTLT